MKEHDARIIYDTAIQAVTVEVIVPDSSGHEKSTSFGLYSYMTDDGENVLVMHSKGHDGEHKYFGWLRGALERVAKRRFKYLEVAGPNYISPNGYKTTTISTDQGTLTRVHLPQSPLKRILSLFRRC